MRRLVASSVLLLAGLLGIGCERETANRPPVALAGDDRLALRGDSLTLDGSGSFDPDDPVATDALTYAWRQLSGPTTVQGSTTSTLSFDADGVGGYVFELAVTDADDAVATDIVAVDVQNVLGVTRIVPDNGAAGVSGQQPVVVFFDAPLRPWTAAASVHVDDVTDSLNPSPVEGNVTLEDDGTAVIFSPVLDWSDLAEYRVTVTTSVLGLDGASLRLEKTSLFTGALTDSTPPTVLSASPSPEGVTGVAHSAIVEIVFSEPVSDVLLQTAFGLFDGVTPVDGVVTLGAGGTRAIFIPADTSGATPNPSPLAGGGSYIARVADTLTDVNGIGLAGGDYARTFQTAAGTDVVAPTVLSVSPLRGAQGISVKLPIVLTFSEPVEPASVDQALLLTSSGSAAFGASGIGGNVVMTHGNTVAIFQPSTNLATGTIYQFQAVGTITDLSGNPLPAAFDTYFVTGDAPPPSVLLVLPDRAPIDTTLTVQVQGEDFVDGATVFVPGGGVLVDQTTFLSETLLQANLTISPSAALGLRPVTVTNPDGQQATGLSLFEILQLPPSVSSLSPNAANLGDTAVPVAVLGANFQPGATVSISGTGVTVDSVTFANAGQLDLTVSVAPGATVGPRAVTVTNPDTQSVIAANAFTVRFPAPTVTNISQGAAGQGESLFSVIVTGTNFLTSPQLPTVDLGSGVLAATVTANATSITINITVSGAATLGAHNVVVTNPDGQSGTLAGGFTVNPAPPSVVSSTPAVSQATTAPVTVSGTGFQCGGAGPQLEVRRGGSASVGVSVDNTAPGLIACNATSFTRDVTVLGSAVVGLHDLRVTNPDAQFSDGANTFEVLEELPQITSLSITQGRRKATLGVNVNGSFFQSAPTAPVVSFGPGIAVSVDSVTAAQIQTTISITDAAALTTRNVVVTNADGQSASFSGFTVERALPSITGSSPTPVNQGDTFVLVVTGDDFDCTAPGPAVEVRRLGAASAGVTEDNATFVACSTTTFSRNVTVGAGAIVDVHDLRVTNPDGGFADSSGRLQIREEAPTIAAVTPLGDADGRRKEVLTTTITGTNFLPGPTVSFGADIAVSVGAVTATTIDVTLNVTNAAALGPRDVTVTNADGQSVTATGIFTVQRALPSITGSSPTPVNQGDAFVLVVTGDDFDCTAPGPAVEVRRLGAPSAAVTEDNATFVACSPTSFSRTVTVGSGAAVAVHDLRATNPDGGFADSSGRLQIREEAPTIAAVTPLSDADGRRKETLSTTITGANFLASPTVSFGADIAVSVGAVTSTTIDVSLSVANAAALGPRDVTVTNSDGQGVTATGIFTVQRALPSITGSSPTPVNQGQSFVLVVTGDDFDCTAPGPAVEVRISGAASADVTEDNATFVACAPTSFSRNVTVGTGAAVAVHDLRVTNPDGGVADSSGRLQIREEAPTIAAVTPLTDADGRRKETLNTTINGANFLANPTVSFGGDIAVSVGTVTATTIDVTLNVTNAAALGVRDVTVTNSDGQSVTATGIFTVQRALPSITGSSPTPVNQGDTFVLVVTGDDFDCTAPGPAVEVRRLGAASADVAEDNATFVACTATSFSRNVTAGPAADVGVHDLRVTNPDGGFADSSGRLQIREEAPTIAAVTPLSDADGRRKETLLTTINGANFLANPTVSFGADIAVSVGTVTGTTIDVTLNVTNAAALGPRDVTVTNSDGQSVTATGIFTVLRALPGITGSSPTPVNQGDSFVLVVTGEDFDCTAPGPAVEARLLGAASTDVSEDNATFVACSATSFSRNVTVGTGAAVAVHDLRVTNPDGGFADSPGRLQIREEAPTIAAVTPLSDADGRRKEVLSTTISGTNFLANPIVSFGADIAVSVGAVTPTTITVSLNVTNAAALGPRDVSVTNSDGQSVTATGIFTVQRALPTITGSSPTPKNQGESFVLVVTGDDFDCSGAGPAVEVRSLGAASADVTEDNATFVACSTTSFSRNVSVGPTAAVAVHDLRVTNPDGGFADSPGRLQIREEAPTIAAVTPLTDADGRRKETLTTTLSGANFLPSPTVSFGADIAVSVSAVSSTSISLTLNVTNAAALGLRDVSVTNSDGQSVTATGIFDVQRALPTITGASPSPKNQGESFVLTVTGDDFDCTAPGPAVEVRRLGAASADVTEDNATFVACSATSFSRNVSIGTTADVASHDLRVTNPDGGFADASGLLQIREEAPIVSALQDSTGAALTLISRKGMYVNARVDGTFFQSGASVSIVDGLGSAIPITSTTFVSAARIDVTFSVPNSAQLGSATITVTNPDGQQGSNGTAVGVRLPAPTLSTVAPADGNEGAAALAVVVTGEDFQCGTTPTMTFGTGILATVNGGTCTATQLDVTLDISSAAGPGLRNVTVTNVTDGQSGTGVGFFEVLLEKPVVTTAIVTATGFSEARRATSVTVRITGDFFQSIPAPPSVSFGSGVGITAVTFVDAQTLDVDVSVSPDPALAALGLRNVIVTNADTQSTTLTNGFEILRAIPTISNIAPNAGSQQDAPFFVTVTGDHFDCSASPGSVPQMTLGSSITVTLESCGGSTSQRATSLTGTVDITATASVGLHNVDVTNPADTETGSGTNLFTVREEKPVAMSVTPNIRQGEALTMTLAGDFFQATPTAIVTTAGTVSSIVWVDPQTVTFTLDVPFATAVGTYDLSLTNPDGQSVVAPGLVNVVAALAPSISSVCNPTGDCSPAWVDEGALGRVLTINGENFQPSVDVTFTGADVTVQAISRISAAKIEVQINVADPATLGLVSVTVVNLSSAPNSSSGLSGQNAVEITEVAPTVTLANPNQGAQGTTLNGADSVPGGLPGVVLTGTNFRAGAVVEFLLTGSVDPNVVVTGVTVIGPTTIELDVLDISPAATIAMRDIRVTNADGSEGTLVGGFEVTAGIGTPIVNLVIRDPSMLGGAAFSADSPNSMRQDPSPQLFHLIGTSFAPSVTVSISGTGITAGAATVDPTGTRIDVSFTAGCTEISTGVRDIIITNAADPVGNGLTGICRNCLIVRRGVVINEVATQDRTDRFNFNTVTETLEIFNGSGCAWNLTNYRLDFIDAAATAYELGSRAASERFSAGSTLASVLPGGYMIISRPDNNNDNMDDDIYISLFSNTGLYLDHVEIGDDQENDGNDGGPAVGNDGANGSTADEMVARCPNGYVTDDLLGADHDVEDFYQNEAVGFLQGATPFGQDAVVPNFAVAAASNNLECPPCADGLDNDGDGWMDRLDPGCADPHTDVLEGGVEATTQCNDNLDNDGDGDGIDENDPDCFSGLDNDEAN